MKTLHVKIILLALLFTVAGAALAMAAQYLAYHAEGQGPPDYESGWTTASGTAKVKVIGNARFDGQAQVIEISELRWGPLQIDAPNEQEMSCPAGQYYVFAVSASKPGTSAEAKVTW